MLFKHFVSPVTNYYYYYYYYNYLLSKIHTAIDGIEAAYIIGSRQQQVALQSFLFFPLLYISITPLRIIAVPIMRNGESTCLPPIWPVFDSQTQRHNYVSWVGRFSTLPWEVFPGYSGFPLSSKT